MLKVSSEASASWPRAWSAVTPVTGFGYAAEGSPRAAACSRVRRAPAGESTASRFMIAAQVPVSSAVVAASRREQDGGGGAGGVVAAADRREQVGDGELAEPVQVGGVVEVLGGDDGGGLGQGQGAASPAPARRPRPGLVVEAGAPGQERQALGLGEDVHVDGGSPRLATS